MSRIQVFFATAAICIFTNCTSDRTAELSGYYFLRQAGPGLNDILGLSTGKDIPPNVLAYGYNDDFIKAVQEPDNIDNAIYGPARTYPRGRDQQYYWLVCHKYSVVLGPMSKSEFEAAKTKYRVPSDIPINPIN